MKKHDERGAFFYRILRGEKGQSIVEITLIAPLLLLALYVPADFGIALFTAHLAENAVREATRIGTGLLDCKDSKSPCFTEVTDQACSSKKSNDIVTEVCNRLPAKLTSPVVTVELWDKGGANCMQSVIVRVSGTYNFFLYQLAKLSGITLTKDTLDIKRQTQMRYNFQPAANNTPCTP